MLDDLAEQHENALVAGPAGLRHVVRDDDDRVFPAQTVHQALDRRGAFGVERRARLVHQDHARLEGQQPGDAELLLLLQRQARRLPVQAVLHVVPELHLRERRLDQLVELTRVCARARRACTRSPKMTFS